MTTRLEELQARLAARTNSDGTPKKGFTANVRAIKAEMAKLSASPRIAAAPTGQTSNTPIVPTWRPRKAGPVPVKGSASAASPPNVIKRGFIKPTAPVDKTAPAAQSVPSSPAQVSTTT